MLYCLVLIGYVIDNRYEKAGARSAPTNHHQLPYFPTIPQKEARQRQSPPHSTLSHPQLTHYP